jgi:hypothetical protein
MLSWRDNPMAKKVMPNGRTTVPPSKYCEEKRSELVTTPRINNVAMALMSA